jgi:hypothetical protein
MRFRRWSALAALSIAVTGAGAAMAVPAGAATTPTVTITPSTGLADGQTVTVTGTGFQASEALVVLQCTPKAQATGSPSDCDTSNGATGTTTSDASGNVSTTFLVHSYTYTDGDSGKCDAADPCLIVLTNLATGDKGGNEIQFTSNPAVTINPSTGVTDKESITVDVSNFTASVSQNSNQTLVTECSKGALAYQSDPSKAIGFCDTSALGDVPVDKNGNGSGPFTVPAGKDYSDSSGGKCDANNTCYIAVASDIGFTQLAFTPVTFASSVITPNTTTTTVGVKGKLVAGKTVTATAITTPGGSLSGKVKFTDNGKKVGTVSETASGKVTEKVKLVKGKNTITATYSGNSTNTSSAGSKTVTAKRA